MQEMWAWSLVWEDLTCCRATKPVCYNYWACALEPGGCNSWSLWALEPVLHNKRSPRSEKPPPYFYSGIAIKFPQWHSVSSLLYVSFSFTQHPDFPSPKILPISSAAVCPSCTSFFSRLWANPSLVVDLPPILASGPFQILLAVLIAVFDPDYCIFG